MHRIDASGNILKTYIYDVFGVEQGVEPLDTNPFRYCGEYFDKETGEIYLRARYYNPATGRFGAEDALKDTGDVLGLNLYVYCKNNPTLFVDPTGNISLPSGGKPYLSPQEYTQQKYPNLKVPDFNSFKKYDPRVGDAITKSMKKTAAKTKPIADPFWASASGPRWGRTGSISAKAKGSIEPFAQLFDVGAGLAKIGVANEDIGEAYLTGPEVSASVSTQGVDLGGSLISSGVTIYSPKLFNHRLEIGLEGNAFGLGVTYGRSSKKVFEWGATALFGGSFSIGIS